MQEKKIVEIKSLLYLDFLSLQTPIRFEKDHLDLLIEKTIIDLQELDNILKKRTLNSIFGRVPCHIIPDYIRGLAKFAPNDQFISIIRYLLYSNRPIYRIIAFNHIKEKKIAGFTPEKIKALFSSYEPLILSAKEAIIKFPENCADILARSLNNKTKDRHLIIIDILKRIAPDNYKLNCYLLLSPDHLERINALLQISKYYPDKVIPLSIPLLSDPDIAVRKTAIEVIGTHKSRKARLILKDYKKKELYGPLLLLASQYSE